MYIAYDFFVKFVFLVKHELDSDWECIDVVFHFLTEIVESLQPCRIFLCSDDYFRLLHGVEGLVYFHNVLVPEIMMVGKR